VGYLRQKQVIKLVNKIEKDSVQMDLAKILNEAN
jgi:hypothetical protein